MHLENLSDEHILILHQNVYVWSGSPCKMIKLITQFFCIFLLLLNYMIDVSLTFHTFLIFIATVLFCLNHCVCNLYHMISTVLLYIFVNTSHTYVISEVMTQSSWRFKSCGLLCLDEWKIVTDFSKDHNIPVSAGVVACLGLFDPEDEEILIFWNVGKTIYQSIQLNESQ